MMETRLKKLLENHTYESKMGLGQRKMMPHHIEALMRDLVPFIEEEIYDAVSDSVAEGEHK